MSKTFEDSVANLCNHFLEHATLDSSLLKRYRQMIHFLSAVVFYLEYIRCKHFFVSCSAKKEEILITNP